MSKGYVRTRVSRLKVSGYRSLYDVELSDLPDVIVFHGKNGTGKSNLMRVPGLVLRWFGSTWAHPTREQPVLLNYPNADEQFGLRPSDFSHGREPVLRVELEVELGSAVARSVEHTDESLGRLRLAFVAEDVARGIRMWCKSATLGQDSLASGFELMQTNPRLHDFFARQGLLLHYRAYRSIGHEPAKNVDGDLAQTFQRRMFAVHIDSDIGRRRQLQRLGQRLGEIGALPGDGPIELAPGLDKRFNEHQLQVAVPGVGDVPLENLGTGQQQLIMMTADALVERRPILQLEEPEAHLHADLMEAFARFLRTEAEIAGPESPIDQIWLSTHHHAFAIAPEYFEVTHDPEAGTKVQRRDRAYATRHFYEPGPLWEALRTLANSTSRETVVMHDADGQPITAGQILDSIDGNRELANEFASAATRTIVSRFRKQPVEAS